MRILFLTHRLPCPPDRGCKLRSAAILYGLAQRHDVWCAGFLDAGDDARSRADAERALVSLREMCREVLSVPFGHWTAGYKALGRLIAGGTATEGYFASRELTRGVTAWAGQIGFDAVFAFSSGMAPLALTVPAARRVLCMDDLDSRKWRELAAHARWPMRLIYDTESHRLAARELEWIDRFDATLMISRREADLVTVPSLRAKVHVFPPILPPQVDVADAEIVPSPELSEPGTVSPVIPIFRPDKSNATGPIVGFVGAMDYEPNVDAACWLARDIWPRVRRCCPDAQLWIVGRSPTQVVRDLAAEPGITVTGTVPDVNAYLRQMQVHVAPVRIARGVQMKVIAAMAAERPCVVTSGVAAGLGARAGRELLVADSATVFAMSIVDLLEHPERAADIARAGRAFVDRFSPDQAMRRLEALLAGENPAERDEASASAGSASLRRGHRREACATVVS